MESQLLNPEFRINPEMFHPCSYLVWLHIYVGPIGLKCPLAC